MSLQINLPNSEWNFKISGVYKITFSDGSFYIGSSIHLRSRASCWSNIISACSPENDLQNEELTKRIISGGDSTFEIIELCHAKDVRDKEALYLYENRDNELMLSKAACSWKPVLQYKNGQFIKKHVSLSAAANFVGTSISRIQYVVNGVKKGCRGYQFIYEHDYHKPKYPSQYKAVGNRKAGREVIMINEKGEVLKRFKKIIEAAREVGCHSKNISRVLNKVQKTAGGYKWEYGEQVFFNSKKKQTAAL